MDEPTNEQLKTLRKDLISGRVMIVEVEHYKKLTDNLDKSYDANKQLEDKIKTVCDLINNEGEVNKWKILNMLSKP